MARKVKAVPAQPVKEEPEIIYNQGDYLAVYEEGAEDNFTVVQVDQYLIVA